MMIRAAPLWRVRPCHGGQVAQSVEQRTENPCVECSIHSLPTKTPPGIKNREMTFTRASRLLAVASVLFALGCATRQVNPPIVRYDPNNGHLLERLEKNPGEQQDLVILAFSGGGTRAAAFSYGVLEALRQIQFVNGNGCKTRMLDEVDLITAVSGGSFTALTYGLYGEKMFDLYEDHFLKRDVQGEIVSRSLDPLYWGKLSSTGWGRSELAADLYDEILFNGATFTDLDRAGGPMILVSATELATGSRVVFWQQNFNFMCADLGPIRIARAAAASSAVPVILSPVTINNYGGTCGYQEPEWLRSISESPNPPRPAARTLRRLGELRELGNGAEDPYLHLVDGGISDNLGLRGVLDVLETLETMRDAGKPTPLGHVRRIIVFVVNSKPARATNWNASANPPGTLDIMMRSSGLSIERYSNEMVEQLKDIDARWKTLRQQHASAFAKEAPTPELHVIEVSFEMLKDKSEQQYLNNLPTSFVLPDEAIQRLRYAAMTIVFESPELKEILKEESSRAADPGTRAPVCRSGSAEENATSINAAASH